MLGRLSGNPCFVAEANGGRVVGFAEGRFRGSTFDGGRIYNERFGEFAELPPPHCKLDWICVADDVRRRGAGRELLHRFASEALQAGCSHIALKADESSDNSGRKAFFTGFGFYALDPELPDHLLGTDLASLVERTG
ncbi:Acetyltransferase (GNAT) family protein [Saccharopolyspora kobensis]|uniref:Acetyltransferase (GNAT) family protein n=1 Tax=Saccharopolyspora kobensis TaxID=146035 RepID=A0A1H6EGS2_9PSEU|nr:Acetyltransferase (GNAT) family protein [Saccharopolyspora kobensis]SFE65856.1 Acetyltransferase (GNAT) family protein [Saccharopolyspora kobensis]